MHRADILNFFNVPIGILSEEAGESRNKDVRNCREFHARKINRKATLRDQFNYLMVSSDPIISSCARKVTTRRSIFTAEMLQFFVEEVRVADDLVDNCFLTECDNNLAPASDLGRVELPNDFYNDSGDIRARHLNFYKK